jgi:hypothetical protein
MTAAGMKSFLLGICAGLLTTHPRLSSDGVLAHAPTGKM